MKYMVFGFSAVEQKIFMNFANIHGFSKFSCTEILPVMKLLMAKIHENVLS